MKKKLLVTTAALSFTSFASLAPTAAEVNIESKMEQKKKIDEAVNVKELFNFNGQAKYNDAKNITTLTENENNQAGTMVGKTAMNINHDFIFEADVFLGENENGADGIAIGFHQGPIGSVGENGGGLGVRGLKGGIAFEMDTFTNAPDDHDPNFNHNKIKVPHAGFVSTDDEEKYLKALAPMQTITKPNNKWRTVKLEWDARNKTLNASLEGEKWKLKDPGFDPNEKYTFVIGAATGTAKNTHQIRIKEFKAHFTKPVIEANDIEIKKGSNFDPLNTPEIKLKAMDETDGDLTDKITIEHNNVDTSKPGNYEVKYKVVNSYGEIGEKTINVKIPVIDDEWENGDISGWKFYAGENITLLESPKHALTGDHVFYSDKHVGIYKPIELEEGATYKATVFIKPEKEENVQFHYVKLSLKDDPAGKESKEIFNQNIGSISPIEKGYRKITKEFTVNEKETNPLLVLENYQAGYIDSIKITKVK
ncbi:lectin family protein/surface protein with Ig-like domain [Bacillus thuringiensis]